MRSIVHADEGRGVDVDGAFKSLPSIGVEGVVPNAFFALFEDLCFVNFAIYICDLNKSR
jgi:hypothetical protein